MRDLTVSPVSDASRAQSPRSAAPPGGGLAASGDFPQRRPSLLDMTSMMSRHLAPQYPMYPSSHASPQQRPVSASSDTTGSHRASFAITGARQATTSPSGSRPASAGSAMSGLQSLSGVGYPASFLAGTSASGMRSASPSHLESSAMPRKASVSPLQYPLDLRRSSPDSSEQDANDNFATLDLPLSPQFLESHQVKHRRRTTAAQLEVLDTQFKICNKPDMAARKKLSAELGMTVREVQVWFQNRRAKQKKLDARAAEASGETLASASHPRTLPSYSTLPSTSKDQTLPFSWTQPSPVDTAFPSSLDARKSDLFTGAALPGSYLQRPYLMPHNSGDSSSHPSSTPSLSPDVPHNGPGSFLSPSSFWATGLGSQRPNSSSDPSASRQSSAEETDLRRAPLPPRTLSGISVPSIHYGYSEDDGSVGPYTPVTPLSFPAGLDHTAHSILPLSPGGGLSGTDHSHSVYSSNFASASHNLTRKQSCPPEFIESFSSMNPVMPSPASLSSFETQQQQYHPLAGRSSLETASTSGSVMTPISATFDTRLGRKYSTEWSSPGQQSSLKHRKSFERQAFQPVSPTSWQAPGSSSAQQPLYSFSSTVPPMNYQLDTDTGSGNPSRLIAPSHFMPAQGGTYARRQSTSALNSMVDTGLSSMPMPHSASASAFPLGTANGLPTNTWLDESDKPLLRPISSSGAGGLESPPSAFRRGTAAPAARRIRSTTNLYAPYPMAPSQASGSLANYEGL